MMPRQANTSQLRKLLLWRLLAFGAVLVVISIFYSDLLSVAFSLAGALFLGAYLILFPVQWHLASRPWPLGMQIVLQHLPDVLIISMLAVKTGGIESPFTFLLGLIIVAAGTQAHAMAVIVVAIGSCVGYLAAIHIFAWWNHHPLPDAATLRILLQTSILLLVGGVMAAIARRHSALQEESEDAVDRHRRLQNLHERVLLAMQEGVLVVDQALVVQQCNAAARVLLGIKESPVAASLYRLWDQMPKNLPEWMQEKTQASFQCEWHTHDRHCLVSVSRMSDDEYGLWIITLIDISELWKLENRLADQQKLAAMGRMAAMLAHEIRNPMQTIAQAVELMRQLEGDRLLRVQGIVSEEVQRLDLLVRDMLDYVQPLQPTPIEVNMRHLLQSSIQQVDMENIHQIHLACSLEVLTLDSGHFRVVLDNLLRNALAVSSEPATVSVSLHQHDGTWRLEVRDQGGGVPEDMQHRVFEPFATAREGGTGLGLATAWQVSQANHWDIGYELISGGTCFMLYGNMDVHDG